MLYGLNAFCISRATASINIDLDQVFELGNLWKSQTLVSMVNSLKHDTGISANAGGILGNRMFFANDYMVRQSANGDYRAKFNIPHSKVQRGEKYVTTLQMYSSRTCNSECLNKQNVSNFCLRKGKPLTSF
jgi:hypothetical protein